MEQELVTLTQPTAYDIPLLAGGHLRIPHAANAAHDIHYSVRTIRNPNDDLQGITPNILLRPLTPAHSTLPQPFIAAKSRYRATVGKPSDSSPQSTAMPNSRNRITASRRKKMPLTSSPHYDARKISPAQTTPTAALSTFAISAASKMPKKTAPATCPTTILRRSLASSARITPSRHGQIQTMTSLPMKKTPCMTRQLPPHFCLAENVRATNPQIPCRKAAAGTNASAAGMMPFFTETKISLTSPSIFSQAVSTIGEKNTISLPVANSRSIDMNNAPNVWQKIAEHIDYYYWNPPLGYPPRWLSVLIFTISLFLWLVAWTPIKVKTAEVMPLSPDNGDEAYIIERTGFGTASRGNMQYSEWVKLRINNKRYWCICSSDFCSLDRKNIFPTEAREVIKEDDISEVIIINNKYYLVTKRVRKHPVSGKVEGVFSLPVEGIKLRLRFFAFYWQIVWQISLWFIFMFFYIRNVYSRKAEEIQ